MKTNVRGEYGSRVGLHITPTDKKAVGLLAAVGGVIALVKIWPKAKARREQKDMEKLLAKVRAWNQPR